MKKPIGRYYDETNISAFKSQEEPHSRFSCKIQNGWRQKSSRQQEKKGKKESVCVIQFSRALKTNEKLCKKADFNRVYNKGAAIQDPFFVVLYFKNGLPFSRIGTSIRKKFGKAHDRNKVRRRIKEIYRLNKSSFPCGYDILFIARKDLSDAFKRGQGTYKDLEECLLGIMKRIGERIYEKSDKKNDTGCH